MTTPTATPALTPAPARIGHRPSTKLALMIWVSVFPTLTVLNLTLGDWLVTLSPVLRTFVVATVAVPVVIYGLMPQLHKIRVRLVTWSATRAPVSRSG